MKSKLHLLDKRDELIWALSLQDFSLADIAFMFNIGHREQVSRIIKKKPSDWSPKWVRRTT